MRELALKPIIVMHSVSYGDNKPIATFWDLWPRNSAEGPRRVPAAAATRSAGPARDTLIGRAFGAERRGIVSAGCRAPASTLEATLTACDEAATWASSIAYEHGVSRNFGLRKLAYGRIRARWGLGAQAAQHVIKKTCDAYATLKANLRAGNLGRPGSTRQGRREADHLPRRRRAAI
jgi:hypothetical protein